MNLVPKNLLSLCLMTLHTFVHDYVFEFLRVLKIMMDDFRSTRFGMALDDDDDDYSFTCFRCSDVLLLRSSLVVFGTIPETVFVSGLFLKSFSCVAGVIEREWVRFWTYWILYYRIGIGTNLIDSCLFFICRGASGCVIL